MLVLLLVCCLKNI